jgi:hypothetical protein
MMITAPEGMSHFATISQGRPVVDLRSHPKWKGQIVRDFDETVPTDYGGLSERRYYTPEGMRLGMLLVIASAIVAICAIVVLFATWGK